MNIDEEGGTRQWFQALKKNIYYLMSQFYFIGDEAKLVYGYAPGSPYEPVPGVAYAATNGGENGPNVPVVPRGIFEDEDELRRHLAMHPAIPSPSVDEDHRGRIFYFYLFYL